MEKKILITTGGLSSVGQTGGISSYTHDLATNLQNAGHEVCVYLIKEENNTKPDNVNYQYKLFNIPATYKGEDFLIKDLLESIHILNPEVIINNDTSYIAGLWPVLKTDIIKISVMHGFARGIVFNNSGIVGKISALNNEFVDFIVCQNSKMLEDVVKKYQVPKSKVRFIPQSFRNLETNDDLFQNKKLHVIFANGNNKNKGAGIMNKIANLLKHSTFEFLVRWCMLTEKMSIQDDRRFEIHGKLTRDEFVNKLKNSDVIIIPTKLDTGPMLLVEAMANGVVALCNNLKNSAIPDVIINGKNGFVVKKNDPKIYFKILQELDQDRNLLNIIKKNAKEYYLNNLTENHQVQNFSRLFIKQEFKPSVSFSNKNIVYYHLKKTSHLPKYSLRRIYLKVRYILEQPITK